MPRAATIKEYSPNITPKNAPYYIPLTEAARILHVHRYTITRWCKSGKIKKFFKRGHIYLIAREEIFPFVSFPPPAKAPNDAGE